MCPFLPTEHKCAGIATTGHFWGRQIEISWADLGDVGEYSLMSTFFSKTLETGPAPSFRFLKQTRAIQISTLALVSGSPVTLQTNN